ncbi:MAG: helix-hairpin-helix domain-containing protein [Butyrivibrio sp.]|nr:helix-hairpin-helix domain-containing protein [Butyrivibrio sp.]
MQKKLISVTAVLILTLLLSGCDSRSSSVVLREVEDQPLEELSSEDESSQTSDTVSNKTPQETEEDAIVASDSGPKVIAVYVCGAVNSPGVYELDEGSRICDALYAADGFSDEADQNYVNLAAPAADGMKLYIPTESELQKGETASAIDSFDSALGETSGGTSENALININTATKDELKSLPGIGDGIAGKIVKYREEKGTFKSCEDIMKVSGIKEKLFSKIKDYITV